MEKWVMVLAFMLNIFGIRCDRLRKIINLLLDGFDGKLSSSKYAKLVKCSEDTALRDIKILIGRGILIQAEGGGCSTSYRLIDDRNSHQFSQI